MGTRETITFNAFSSHSDGAIPNGYGGFDWLSVYEIGSYWVNKCYNNALRGSAEAFTSPFSDEYGAFESANLKDSFTLKSMIAASVWCGSQDFTFISYSYKNGAFTLKASVSIDVAQTGTKIDFGKYGADFKGIAAIRIDSMHGNSGGNTCTYHGATYGYQMAFDNMKVVFKHGIPVHRDGPQTLLPVQELHRAHAQQLAMAHVAHTGAQHAVSDPHNGPPQHHAAGGYHSQLLPLHDPPGHPTGQFALPGLDHFGT